MLELIPQTAHPMDVLRTVASFIGNQNYEQARVGAATAGTDGGSGVVVG